jgi:hypothetical protein
LDRHCNDRQRCRVRTVCLDTAATEASSNVVTKIPAGYRDWKLISVAHEEANLNSFAAVLVN